MKTDGAYRILSGIATLCTTVSTPPGDDSARNVVPCAARMLPLRTQMVPTRAVERASSPKSRYFLGAACLALAVTLIGFFKTFLLPSARGTFSAPAVIYVHGGFLFLWTAVFVTQTMLIRVRKPKLHRQLGFLSIGLIPCVVISTMAAGVVVMKRDLALGGEQALVPNLLGNFTTPILFAVLAAAGIAYRRRLEVHKRLMLLAMIAIIWPAFLRFRHYFPPTSDPQLVFGFILPNSMIVAAILWEKITVGRVHVVYLTAGVALIAEAFAEVYLFGSSGWRALDSWLAGFFL
jgi:uncharacterized membrane protein